MQSVKKRMGVWEDGRVGVKQQPVSHHRTTLPPHYLATSSHRLVILLGAAFYIACVQGVCNIEVFTYSGNREMVSPDPFLILFPSLLAFLPSLWLSSELKRPSQIVYWLLYLLVYVPATTVPFYMLDENALSYLLFAGLLCACFSLLGVIPRLPLLQIRKPQLPPILFWAFIGLLAVIFNGYIVSVFGLQFRFISFLEVYGVRSEFKAAAAQAGTIATFFISWQGYVINPLLITYGLTQKKPLFLILGLLGQIFLYSITAFKSVIFSALILIVMLIATRKQGRNFGMLAIWGSVAVIVLAVIVEAITDARLVAAVAVNRPILLPGLLTGYYFEFFSVHPHTFLTDDKWFKWLGDYPYSVSVPELIGLNYFPGHSVYANANVWASAFAHFGWMGVLVGTIFLGFVLWLYDGIAKRQDIRIASLMLALPAFTLANSAFVTSLIGHGLGFVLMIAYLMPSFDQESRELGAESRGNRWMSVWAYGYKSLRLSSQFPRSGGSS